MAEPYNYPFLGGMPNKTGLSSDPVNLTTIPAVEAFLAETPFASRSITDLTGGSANYAYRIHLAHPFRGHHTVVVKHAQPHVKSWPSLRFALARQKFEVEALMRVKSWLPSTSIVTVPDVYHFDAHNNLIIMEDCGSDSLKNFLCSGKASPAFAEAAGKSLGHFIGSMHEWSKSNPGGILDVFNSHIQAKEMSVFATYGRLISTLDYSGDILPKLLDPAIEVDASDLASISKIVHELQNDMILAHEIFVMGDFWPGNMMVKLNPDQSLCHIYILLDWELAKTGIPGVELGQFAAEMHLLMCFNEVARDSASLVLSNAIQAYASVSQADDRLARDTIAHWGAHLVVWTPRVPWGDKETTQRVVIEGVRLLADSRKADILSQSPVKALLSRGHTTML